MTKAKINSRLLKMRQLLAKRRNTTRELAECDQQIEIVREGLASLDSPAATLERLGTRIYKYRWEHDITSYQPHAVAHGLQSKSWRNAEQGLSLWTSIGTYIRIAESMRVSFEELYGGKHD
jgi:hypothetical protein